MPRYVALPHGGVRPAAATPRAPLPRDRTCSGATGIAAEADQVLGVLRTGDILHFEFNHFVVLDTLSDDRVRIMDPTDGSHRLDRAAFASHFTGVALLFERSPQVLEERMRSIGIPPAPAQ